MMNACRFSASRIKAPFGIVVVRTVLAKMLTVAQNVLGEVVGELREALCFVGLCVAEGKRRGLDTADWLALAMAVSIGPEEEVAVLVTEDKQSE